MTSNIVDFKNNISLVIMSEFMQAVFMQERVITMIDTLRKNNVEPVNWIW